MWMDIVAARRVYRFSICEASSMLSSSSSNAIDKYIAFGRRAE